MIDQTYWKPKPNMIIHNSRSEARNRYEINGNSD
jgi:hypothetical protein